jgi:hypothetical protein
MIYYEAGEKQQINFVTRDEFPLLSTEQQAAVEPYWQELLVNKPDLFNGPLYACNGIVSETAEHIIFGINQTDYATYKYMRDHGILAVGTYAIGDGTFIYQRSDDSFVFLERTDKVGFDEGTISGTGGALSVPNHPVADHDFMQFISDHARQETAEELIIEGLEAPVLLGFYLDEDTFKLEFIFAAAAIRCQLNADDYPENTRVITVKRGEVTTLLTKQLETSTKKHLQHWAARMDERPLV